ncbi:transglutaminase family protein [Mechercharimyces sp. CAU 1602]|uniref:transglutaminase-like domain-containing protein n=1 Tax=Mechercharimyces sp. CAU 1602 TaxID=2973933 RepID=UPI0021617D9F|nr:transglutaminase-like domain-containing protein [Mechercharimyces sp. CAU 1602]MCS1351992.1 transglutaminase-like domain-containing protein [Mechercharimyces sp. CAU 1602]
MREVNGVCREGWGMGMKKGSRFFVIMVLLFTIVTGCSWSDQTRSSADPFEQKIDEVHDGITLKPLQLREYATDAGVELSAPEYEKFAVNAKVDISGKVASYKKLKSNYLWIVVEKVEEDNKTAKENVGIAEPFDYYVPIKEGVFKKSLTLFAGSGTYQVTVRLPSMEKSDQYQEITQFKVINVNEKVERDMAFTPIGLESGVTLAQPQQGYMKAERSVQLEGAIRSIKDDISILVRIEQEGKKWEKVLPVHKGVFSTEVPLLFEKGVHHLSVLIPSEEKEGYYQKALSFLAEKGSREPLSPITYYKHYQERGIQLLTPTVSGDRADDTYTIEGKIDPDAPFARETEQVIVQTEKDGKEASYIIPVKDYHFKGEFWLRFGPGKYEVIVNVPEVTKENRDFFRFYGVAQFQIDSSAPIGKENLYPSRGVQSNDKKIKELAQSLTKGAGDERAQAKKIYRYVSRTIKYDVPKFRNDTFSLNDSALKALAEKKGVCQDYAFLAVALLRANGMEARFVEGYAEGVRHAWVEVRIGGEWVTMDPTWGSGYINQRDVFVPSYTEKYFDPEPTMFNRTHKRTGIIY